jgi:hypothetical protein
MNKIRHLIIGCAAVGATALATSAVAMPIAPLNTLSDQSAVAPQAARWMCGPFHCRWRPNWYGSYGYYDYGPRFYRGPNWGWHRWHRWHRW